MLGATGNDVAVLARLVVAERTVPAVRYIASAAIHFEPEDPFWPKLLASLPGPTQVINNLVGIGPTQLATLTPTAPPAFESVQGGIRLPPQPPASPAQGRQQQPPSGFDHCEKPW